MVHKGFLVWAAGGLLTLHLLAPRAPGDCEPEWLYGPGQGIPGVDGIVRAVTTWDPDGRGPQAELLVVAGEFEVAGDIVAHSIAAWDGHAWQALGSGMGEDYVRVSALAVYNGDLIAGGWIVGAGGVSAENIASWNGTRWAPLGVGVDGGVYAFAVYAGELIAGGRFATAGDVYAKRIASWNGTAWKPLEGGIDAGMDAVVEALTIYNGALIAVGGLLSQTLRSQAAAPAAVSLGFLAMRTGIRRWTSATLRSGSNVPADPRRRTRRPGHRPSAFACSTATATPTSTLPTGPRSRTRSEDKPMNPVVQLHPSSLILQHSAFIIVTA